MTTSFFYFSLSVFSFQFFVTEMRFEISVNGLGKFFQVKMQTLDYPLGGDLLLNEMNLVVVVCCFFWPSCPEAVGKLVAIHFHFHLLLT